MSMKTTITSEFEREKRHFHSSRLLLLLMRKKITASSDIFKLSVVMYLTFMLSTFFIFPMSSFMLMNIQMR